jgi:multiple antibiotic resistance protein
MLETSLTEIWRPHGGFFVTAFISLFVIIDPLVNAFAFLSLSAGSSPGDRRRLARRSCLYAFLVLTVFLVLGQVLLLIFGITLAAFQIAGGLILAALAVQFVLDGVREALNLKFQ